MSKTCFFFGLFVCFLFLSSIRGCPVVDNGVKTVENHCISFKDGNKLIVINAMRMQENYVLFIFSVDPRCTIRDPRGPQTPLLNHLRKYRLLILLAVCGGETSALHVTKQCTNTVRARDRSDREKHHLHPHIHILPPFYSNVALSALRFGTPLV